MGHRLVRLAAVIGVGVSWMWLPPSSVGLSCLEHADVERAAREAVAGQHPLWADAYVVARLDHVERRLHAPFTLTVTPTHVFGDDLADRTQLAARSDGPPDPTSWHVGGHYFLALEDADLDDGDFLVSPCAPNFQITRPDQLAELVAAADGVEVVRTDPLPPTTPIAPLAAAVGACLVVAASVFAFRRRR